MHLDGQNVPCVKNIPFVPADMDWIVEAFWLLSASRPVGFSIGAIPLVEMQAYCDIHGVSDRRFFVRAIRALDTVYVEMRNNELEKKTKK